MRRVVGRRGVSILEVVVALTVLEVGLVGVAGLVALAARDLARARTAGWAVGAVSDVADSLGRGGVAGSGTRDFPGGSVRWTVAEGPAEGLVSVVLDAEGPDGRPGLRVLATLPTVDGASAASGGDGP